MKRFSSVLIGIAAAAATYAALWFSVGPRSCNYNYYGHRYSHHAHYGHYGHYNHCDYNHHNQFSDSSKAVN